MTDYDEAQVERVATVFARANGYTGASDFKMYFDEAREAIDAMAEPPKPKWPTDETLMELTLMELGYSPKDERKRVRVAKVLAETDPIIKAAVAWYYGGGSVDTWNDLRQAIEDSGL